MSGRDHDSRRFPCGIALSTLLTGMLISGCTTHYRESMDAYRNAEPTPFYQRTLEWAEGAPAGDTPPEVVVPSTPDQSAEDAFAAPDTGDRGMEVAARVLGIPVGDFVAQAAPEAIAGREAALGNRLAWRDLMLATALGSPRIEAARQEWKATLMQYGQAEYLEGLLREYQTFTRFLDLGAGASLQKEMVKEFFPYPSATAWRGEMIREQVRLAELAWERALRDALVEAGLAFFDYHFQHQGAATAGENVKLLENLVDVVQDRYATGLAAQPDVLRLQMELERQRNILRDFQARQRATAAALNALLGRPTSAPIGPPVAMSLPLPPDSVEALTAQALERRQEVLEQRARVARAEIAIRMGEIMNRPLFSGGYSTLDRGMMPEASTGALGVPFASRPDAPPGTPDYAQAEAYLGEMRERLVAERATLAQIELETGALARGLFEQADIARRQAELLRDVILPLSQSAYEISLNNYTVGTLTFLDLLDAERELIDTRLERDGAQRDRNQAIVRIATLRGFIEGML